MSKQEFLYVYKALLMSYIPLLLINLLVEFLLSHFLGFQKRNLSDTLIFSAVIIYTVCILNLWNTKRNVAFLKPDTEPTLKLQLVLNTILFYVSVFFIFTFLKVTGNYISGLSFDNVLNAKDISIYLIFIGLLLLYTLIKKLRSAE